MIVIAIIGILGVIAFPAYASYMKKAKYTEVFNVAESVKTPIALCIQEYGITQASKCKSSESSESTPASGSSGFGWAIKAPTDYATKYVAKVVVTGKNQNESGEVARITVTPQGDIGEAATLILIGEWTKGGQLNWLVSGDSGCALPKYELCVADTAASKNENGGN